MPLLDSFTVDHTRMEAPAVRVAKTMNTPHGDAITVFDLRFCVPNKEVMPERGIHTLEHLFAGFMRNHLNGNGVEIIDISPMGCRTGFYMSLIGTPDEQRVADAWKAAMEDVLKVQDQNQIPELSIGLHIAMQVLDGLCVFAETGQNVIPHGVRHDDVRTLREAGFQQSFAAIAVGSIRPELL